MINKPLILRKLNNIKQYLEELSPIIKKSFEEYKKDYFLHRTAERLLILLVETASDINSHLSVNILKKPPANYFDSFEKMGCMNVTDKDFAKEIAQCAGLRNRLIHEYEKIDDKIVYDSIFDAVRDFTKYLRYVREFIKQDFKSQ
jgi:uncharacterized protein YutE (UPF0331/DUF86 family)